MIIHRSGSGSLNWTTTASAKTAAIAALSMRTMPPFLADQNELMMPTRAARGVPG
jgi:hypothetical protein